MCGRNKKPMKKVILSFALMVLIGCGTTRPGLQTETMIGREQCLQDIAFRPLGIDIQGKLLHTPQEIQARFGRPDSVQMQDLASSTGVIGQTITYSYKKGMIFTFMTMKNLSCLYSLEVTGGKMGCLKIGMSKDVFESEYGPIGIEDGTGIENRSYFDDNGTKFGLILEFKANKLVKITPEWDEVFGIGSL
jgi:hypothetical protein